LLTIGRLFWAACAALAGSVVGALFSGGQDGQDVVLHVGLGAAIGVGCYAWLCFSLVTGHRRSVVAAAANEDARMRYQAQLNAEAMAEVAQRERAQAQAQLARMPVNNAPSYAPSTVISSSASSSSPSDRSTSSAKPSETTYTSKPRFLN